MPTNPEPPAQGFGAVSDVGIGRSPGLRVYPLTREGFSRFGEVIEASSTAQRRAINGGTAERYDALAEVDTGPQGRTIVSIFRSQPRELPLLLRTMERHPLASQAFVPLSGRRWLVVVAPAGNPPAADELVAFLASGQQGVNYGAGVWHHPLIALDAVSDFLVIDRAGPGANCDEIALPKPAVIETLPSSGSESVSSSPTTCAGSN